jgi:alpha/beta superfamily hydrolase
MAGNCTEFKAWEEELRYLRAVHAKNSTEAQDARISQQRFLGLAAHRQLLGYHHLAKAFVELGYATLRFNFRGVGASEGNYDEGNGETLDAIAAVNFMRDAFPDLPLLLAGFSFGAYVQARVAEEVHPQRLVLIAPAVSRFAMPDVPTTTLVIHGDMDEVVDLQALLQWARPQQLPVIVLTGAEHFFHGRLIQLKKVVMQGNPPPKLVSIRSRIFSLGIGGSFT